MQSHRITFITSKPKIMGTALILLMLILCLGGCTSPNGAATESTEAENATDTMTATEDTSNLNTEISDLFAEKIDSGSFMYLSLEVPDSKDWNGKELSAESANGTYYEQCIANAYDWQELTEQETPESSTYTLTISNDSGANYFQFYGDTDVVYYYQDGQERWFSATPIEGAGAISDLFHGWYDDVEYQTAVDNTTVSGKISDFDQVATAYGEGLATAFLEFAPGSAYEVTYAQLYSAEVYDAIEGDDTQFCFTLTLEVQPVEINSSAWMSGGGMSPVEDGNQGGHWLKTIQVRMEKVDGLWHCVETGTGGISLSN